jgi:hypothetical protein
MKITLTILPVLLSIVVVMNSCTKTDDKVDSNNYYMRFKANGVQKEYKANAAGRFNKPLGGATEYVSTLGGTKAQFEATKSNLTIALTTVGTNSLNLIYTNYSTTAAGTKKPKLLQFAYFDENGKFYMSYAEDMTFALPAGSPINSRLIVTEASSSIIKGTFTCILYSQDFSKVEVTDGEFYLEVQ